MKEFNSEELIKIMNISQKISNLNFLRFKEWNDKFLLNKRYNKKKTIVEGNYTFSQAIFSFKGDVYKGFDIKNWRMDDFKYANNNLRIISGFYGIIKPLDFIKPYRLEMGTKIKFKIKTVKYNNFYDFWKEKLTSFIIDDFKKTKSKYIINLASVEYSKSIDLEKFKNKVIYIDFKISKNGLERIIAIHAKRQRGEMANWIIKNKIENISDLKKYKNNGFVFSKKSTEKNKIESDLKIRLNFVKKIPF